jgi:cell filamentation protein
MSRYDGVDRYTYPKSEVLRNKADIQEQDALDAFEADATAVRMLELLDHPIQGVFDLTHLQAIHHHLFQDIYEWAGDLRTVDISKGNSRFANYAMIESYLGKALHQLPAEHFLLGLPPNIFVARLAHYMSEINAAHPFREGNGRAQRVFLFQLAEQAGYFIGFEDASRDEMYTAMIASFHGNAKPLTDLLDRITAIIDPE